MDNKLERLRQALLNRAYDLGPAWLRNGVVKGHYLHVGSVSGEPGDSLRVNLDTGQWRDFAEDGRQAGGSDLISLYAAINRVSYRDAVKRLASEHLDDRKPKTRTAKPLAISPVPEDAPNPPLQPGRPSPVGNGVLTASWLYRDEHGRRLGYVARFEAGEAGKGKPKKAVLPLFLFGPPQVWKWAGPGWDRNPIYGLDRLGAAPETTVLLVEGEKTADAAGDCFPDYAAISWLGGINRLADVDWSPLRGRRVTYWPDADEPGRGSVELVVQLLRSAGVAELRIVNPPEDLPNRWDLADEPPQGMDLRSLLDGAKIIDLANVDPLQSLDYEGLVQREVFVIKTAQFIDPRSGLRLETEQLNSLFAHKQYRIGASLLKDERLRKVIGYAYRPGAREQIVQDEHGQSMFNLWQPSTVTPIEGDAGIFERHLRNLCSTEEEFEYLANFLAFLFQRPGVKLMWAVVLVGKQGTGKSGLIDILCALLGERNVRLVSTAEIKSDFNDFLEAAQLVAVEEIMAAGRLEIMNKLKPYITQQTLRVNVKYQRPYEIENAANFIFLSNHRDALRLGKDDRRYFVIMSDAERKEQAYYHQLFAWAGDNPGVILKWLLSRDLSGFDHKAPPPMTAGKLYMRGASRPELEAAIDDGIRDRTPPFEHDLVDLNEIIAGLRGLVSPSEITHYKVRAVLDELGARQLGQCKAWVAGRDVRRSLWAIRDIERLAQLSSSDAIRAYLAMRPDGVPF